MKKPMLYILLTLSAALLFSACGEKEDVIRPGETMSASETAASAAAGGTLQKDGSRWSITSLADWDEFDSDGNFSDNCHAFLRAMLEGESDFDGFRLLRVSEYRLTRDEKEYGLPCLYFEFTVTASDIEALPVGSHTAILTDAVDCFLKLDGAAPKNDGAFADDPAAAAVRGWIESRLRWSVPDYGTAEAADAVAYLLSAYGEEGALPFDTLRTLAAEKLGVALTEADAGGRLDVRGGKLYELYPALDGKGVDFYDASGEEAPADREARLWIDAVINDKTPVVTPEQAYCVSRILNGIYESAKTGEPYYFD